MSKITNSHQLYVRYAETDQMGVVYHSNYLIYFETGRNELMRKHSLSLTKFEKEDNVFFPLIDCYTKYFISARYDDQLAVETSLSYSGGVIFLFEYIIFRDGDKICEGYTRHCFISQVTRKPVRPSVDLVVALRLV